jgi:hypothetical protein
MACCSNLRDTPWRLRELEGDLSSVEAALASETLAFCWLRAGYRWPRSRTSRFIPVSVWCEDLALARRRAYPSGASNREATDGKYDAADHLDPAGGCCRPRLVHLGTLVLGLPAAVAAGEIASRSTPRHLCDAS